jgi:hypothetical protein
MRLAKDWLDFSPTLYKALNGTQGDILRVSPKCGKDLTKLTALLYSMGYHIGRAATKPAQVCLSLYIILF